MKKSIIYNAEPKEINQSAIDVLIRAGFSVIDDLKGCDLATIAGLFVRTYTKVDVLYLQQFANLKFILRAGVGLDNIDLDECKVRNITVFNSPGANSDAVAEYVLTMSLYVLRGIGPQIKQVQNNNWRSALSVGQSLFAQTFGLVGCGHAGRSLAAKLTVLGAKCLAYDPYVSQATMQALGIEKSTLDTVLSHCDIVVIMLPLTKETAGIMHKDNLASLKPGSILINVSRGEMVDENALVEYVRSGHIRTAILDVVIGEPLISEQLRSEPKIIITPHIAGYTIQANANIAQVVVDNFLASRSKR